MVDLIDVSLQFGGRYLFRDVNLKINSGDKLSLVGANGTGKTSLLRMLNGSLQPEKGNIYKQRRLSIGYLPQENVTHSGKTVLEEASSAFPGILAQREKETEITRLLETVTDEAQRDELIYALGDVHQKLQEYDSYSLEARVSKVLRGLGFEEEDLVRMTDEFSGGWQMRLALAKILIAESDLIMLDEPTNHLDIDSLEWLTSFLQGYKGSLLIVSHDKTFIDNVTDKTLEIYLGKFNIFNGKYDDYLKFKEERDRQTEALYETQQKKIKETERFIERFRYKASKARQVQSRVKKLEKVELIELPEYTSEINLRFPPAPPSGRTVMTLSKVHKYYGEKQIFRDLDFEIMKGDKIAFVGPNGAGKTTLAKILAGVTDISHGQVITGHNVMTAYYAQDVTASLDPDIDILETIAQVSENTTVPYLRGLLGSFLFTGDDVFKKVGVLSGGEKSRVCLAKILSAKFNFIILDEPTNHLDISSKKILQKALSDFEGSLVLVSHDVDFLRPIVNKVVRIERGLFRQYEDGIDYYLLKRNQEAAAVQQTAAQVKKSAADTTRKDIKRLEAELRQEKYNRTKDLRKKLEKSESEIALLEGKQKSIEDRLADPTLYQRPDELKAANAEYKEIKEKLAKVYGDWETVSIKLDEIDREFEERGSSLAAG